MRACQTDLEALHALCQELLAHWQTIVEILTLFAPLPVQVTWTT